MNIALQLTPSVARSLRGLDAPSDASRALAGRAARLGVSLRPQHPRASAPPLVSFFVADVNGADADAVLDGLRADASVEGAWKKPDDELPGGAR